MQHIRTRIVIAVLTTIATAATAATMNTSARRPQVVGTWAQQIHEVYQALGAGDAPSAARALRDAQVAARSSRSWEGLLEVGTASLQVGDATGDRDGGLRKAREAYLAAMLRARAVRSFEGVVQAAEAFAMLGDHEVARTGLELAEPLTPAADAQSAARLDALRDRLAGRGSTDGSLRMQ
jgi:hypothetical protein